MSDKDRASKLDPPAIHRRTRNWQKIGVIVFAMLFVAFPLYRSVDASRRVQAIADQDRALISGGRVIWSANCATCHGVTGEGGEGPALDAKEFLAATSDDQMHRIVSAGITGTDMPAWLVDFGGPLTDQQIAEVVAFVRSWQPTAPSCPNFRKGDNACAAAPSVIPIPGAIQVTLGESSSTQMFINLSAATAAAGKITFQVTNEGTKTHEFVVLRTDTPAGAIAIGSFEGQKDRINEEGGGQTNVGETGDVAPGQTKILTLTLPAGHYAVVCNLPGHYRMGMHADFTVS